MRDMHHIFHSTVERAAFKPQSTKPSLGKNGTNLFQFQNKDYLVTVDYFSNFFEIDYLSTTTSNTAIKKLKRHFAWYGIPDEVVSDNRPQYDSDEFQAFAKSFGFKHTRTSPHHPQSNGKAESAVKQAKKILQMTRESDTDYCLALLNIRNTPHEGHNHSPAQQIMNRRTRRTLPEKPCQTPPDRKQWYKHSQETSETTTLLQQRSKNTRATARR